MELLRDRRAEFDEAGVQPIGISRDSPWTHIAWRQALDLNFGLLSDWNAEAVRGFGIGFEFRGLQDVAERSAFLVARDGTIPGALVIPRNALEWRLDPSSGHCHPQAPGFEDQVIVVCDEGYQSSLAAATLQELGFAHATDLDGGFQAWRAVGLPVTPPRA